MVCGEPIQPDVDLRLENSSFNSPIIAPLRDTGLAGLAGARPPGEPGGLPGAGGTLLGGGPGGPDGAAGAEAAGAIPECDLSALISLFTAFI